MTTIVDEAYGYKRKEFTISLLNCLKCDSELTEEQAVIFAKAYGPQLFDLAMGRIDSGLDASDMEEYTTRYKL